MAEHVKRSRQYRELNIARMQDDLQKTQSDLTTVRSQLKVETEKLKHSPAVLQALETQHLKLGRMNLLHAIAKCGHS